MDPKRRIVHIDLPGEHIVLDVPAVEPCKGSAIYPAYEKGLNQVSPTMQITNMTYDTGPQAKNPFKT
jgi:hypothetical protein